MSRQKMSLNTLSGPDSRDLSVRDPAGRIWVSAWFCQTLSEVPTCYLGITRGRVRTFYLPVLPLYGFTKLYTNPFLIIYLLPNFKFPVLVLFWGLRAKKTKSVFPQWIPGLYSGHSGRSSKLLVKLSGTSTSLRCQRGHTKKRSFSQCSSHDIRMATFCPKMRASHIEVQCLMTTVVLHPATLVLLKWSGHHTTPHS
jgi:hypothetical protein